MFTPRTVFPPHNIPLASLASHHRRTLESLKTLGKSVDLVLELRDCRAPLSGINPLLTKALPGIPKLTLYTKREIGQIKESIISPIHNGDVKDFRMIGIDKRKYVSRLLRDIKHWASEQVPPHPIGYRVLVCGMPNSGKSTLINEFRRISFGNKTKKVAFTGSLPGITRSISEQITLSMSPKVYVLDTPGVMLPQVQDWEHMLKLCLIGAVPRSNVDPVVLADYLLFHINLHYPNGGRYPGKQSNDIMEVLWNIAQTCRRRPKRELWDPNSTASEWVDRYIRGGLAKLQMDDLSPENVQKTLSKLSAEC